jgi:F-type H+-transporting ATPase subunit alpha
VSRVGGSAQIGPMKKIAGRLKIDLSQYRDLEAFAQFGSDLDASTQQTLARGDRLVRTLNQNERSPLPVEEQVLQIYAASQGFVDRVNVDRVQEFLEGLTSRVKAENADLLKTVAGGDWSDETQDALKKAIGEFADDFGYDLDEDGQPTAEGDSDRVARRDETSSDEAEAREEQAEEAAVA